MGNLCGHRGRISEDVPDVTDVSDEFRLDSSNNDSIFMIKEFIMGKHETIDFCESKGNSFFIPKAKKIERVNSNNSIPILDSSSWEHDYNDSRGSTPKIYGTPSTYGTPSPYQSNQRPPSFTSCLCDPPSSPLSQNSDSMSCCSDSVPKILCRPQTIKDIEKNQYVWRSQILPPEPDASNSTRSSSMPTNSSNYSEPTNDSTPPSRVGREKRWKRSVCYDPYDSFNSFERKKWIWRDFSLTPRGIPMTPIVSNNNIPPPVLKKL